MDEELEFAVVPEATRGIAVLVLTAPNVNGVERAEPEVATPNVLKGEVERVEPEVAAPNVKGVNGAELAVATPNVRCSVLMSEDVDGVELKVAAPNVKGAPDSSKVVPSEPPQAPRPSAAPTATSAMRTDGNRRRCMLAWYCARSGSPSRLHFSVMERRMRVVIAKPGLDGHDRGAKVIARALRDAGMEVIYTGLHQTPEQIVETILEEDADALGISVLSGAHMTLVPRILDLMRERGVEDVCVVVGGTIPNDDVVALKQLGVAEVFTPGSPTSAIVEFLTAQSAA